MTAKTVRIFATSRLFYLALGLFLASLLCSSLSLAESSKPEQVRISLAENAVTFWVEIAATPKRREQGLMYRQALAADQGMLFIYPSSQVRRFWMKNTLVPLDLIFFDDEGKILRISQGTPLSEAAIPSGQPARLVLEINQGLAARYQLQAGDRIELSPLKPYLQTAR